MTPDASLIGLPDAQLARRLAAYLPVTLARQIAQGEAPVPGAARRIQAATLFADISGFTAMSEELAADGPRGAEELSRILLRTFTPLIDTIHRAGGAISHFHGDAMTVYFPEDGAGQAARQALACAQAMQRQMAAQLGQARVERTAGRQSDFPLTLKIGVGYGPTLAMVVGDAQLEFVLAGAAVEEAAAAEKQAKAGQIAASRRALAQAGLPAAADYALLEAALPPPAARPLWDWADVDAAGYQRLLRAAAAFLPNAVTQRLRLGWRSWEHSPLLAATPFLAEHRPVTSLFVQFDGLDFASDQAGQLLQAYYLWASGVVARYGSSNGHLNRVLIGDKGSQLHIIFGAPVAPDAPEQAVRCALALRREQPAFIRSQQFGLAAGKAFAAPIGSAARCEYTVVGDVVNLSARLMQLSQPGEIVMDAVTARRVGQVVALAPLPPVQLKGKQTLVTPQRVARERQRGGPLAEQMQPRLQREPRLPLIGREREIDLLFGGMDAAVLGVGGAAAISGARGVGKTRLAAEGLQYWREQGGADLIGFGQSHLTDAPYGPWLEMWRDFFGLAAGMPAATQRHLIFTRTAALWPEAAATAALWADVMGVSAGELPAPLADLTPAARRDRFFTLVRRCLTAYARQRPLLLCFEDVHWADRTTLELIDAVTADMNQTPLFVIMTLLSPENALPLTLLQRPTCARLHLADLPAHHAPALLRPFIGNLELPPAAEQRLGLRDRDGRASPINPLFLQEALRALEELGGLRRNGKVTLDSRRLQEMQLPDTIHGLILARLDRLPASSRQLAQMASVIGRQFELPLLQSLTPQLSPEEIGELLAGLADAGITQLIAAEPAWVYRFQHVLTREVAYESLPYAQRQTLHAAIAAWLEHAHQENLKPVYAVLAYHYGQAQLPQKGLRFAAAAADEARRIFANWEAVDLYAQAVTHLQRLGVAADAAAAIPIYLSYGHVLLLLGEFERAEPLFEQGRALAAAQGETAQFAHACNLLAELKVRQTQYADAARYTQPVKLLAGQIAADELALAYLWDGWTASHAGSYDQALRELQQAAQLCQDAGNQERLALSLEAIAFAYYSQRELDQALAALLESVQLARVFSTPVNVGYTLNNLAWCQYEAGYAAAALTTLNEAAGLGEKASRNLLAVALTNRGGVLSYLGEYEAALHDFERAVDLLELMDDKYMLIEAHLQWGYEYAAAQGKWAEAAQHLQAAQALIGEQTAAYPQEQARLLIGLAQTALARNQPEQAAALLAQAQSLAQGMPWWQPAIAYFAGLACRHRGDTAAARQQFHDGCRYARAQGCPDYLPLLLLELARLETAPAQRQLYLEQCLTAAARRARHADRLYCRAEAERLL